MGCGRVAVAVIEAEIRKSCRALARALGWEVVPIPNFRSGSFVGGQRQGAPDDIMFREGRIVWIEYKTAKGRQSTQQVAFQSTCEQHGIEYHVIRSDQELQAVLTGEQPTDESHEW